MKLDLAAIKARANAATRKSLDRHRDWREIPSAIGYCASPDGGIWSVFFRCHGLQERQLQAPLNKDGYQRVRLTLPWESERRTKRSVHRLVCEAFHGAAPDEAMQVRHLDGVKTNNSPDNLRWGTAKENGLDKVRLGESSPGEENGSAELSNADVVIVRTLLGKLPIRVIAELVGVTKSCINRIASGRGWVHIRADMPTLVARVEELESAIGAMLDYKDACDAADGASSELGDDTLTDMNHAAFRQLRAVMDRPEIVTKGSP